MTNDKWRMTITAIFIELIINILVIIGIMVNGHCWNGLKGPLLEQNLNNSDYHTHHLVKIIITVTLTHHCGMDLSWVGCSYRDPWQPRLTSVSITKLCEHHHYHHHNQYSTVIISEDYHHQHHRWNSRTPRAEEVVCTFVSLEQNRSWTDCICKSLGSS